MVGEVKSIKSVDVKLDLETAADLADFFVARGKPQQALQTYAAVLKLDPHIDAVRRRYVELLFRVNEPRWPLGTVERSRMLLSLLGMDVLTEAVEAAYFENLERLLDGRPRPARPGVLVLGLGSGRCGSTSLARALSGIEIICATHENPPMVHWRLTSEQLGLHCKRFRLLLDHFEVVFDSAHWWLNALDHMAAEFDGLKMIGLMRDADACARSFLEIKGTGLAAINHWVDHDGTFWKPALWDRFYPSYDPESFALGAPGGVSGTELASRQHELVRTYVADYNAALKRAKERLGERLLLLRTEDLSEGRTTDWIQAFLGIEGLNLQDVLNRGSLKDGDSQELRF
jgi:hypothetical protein